MSRSDDVWNVVQFAVEKYTDELRRKIHANDMEASAAGARGSGRHALQVKDSCAESAIAASNEAVRLVQEHDPEQAAGYDPRVLVLFNEIKATALSLFSRGGQYRSGLGYEADLDATIISGQANAITTFRLKATESKGEGDREDIGLAILNHFAKNKIAHRMNVLGRPHQAGGLEYELGRRLEEGERGRAAAIMNDLLKDGLLEATYTDMTDPENWLRITEAGREALEKGASNELDARLLKLGPQLPVLRRGAWDAVISQREDSTRQAAHSARELVTQVLHLLAPDEVCDVVPFNHGPILRSVHCRIALLVNSLPLSLTIIFGLPRPSMIRSSSRATRRPERDVSATRRKHPIGTACRIKP